MTYSFTDDLQVEEFIYADMVDEMNEAMMESEESDWDFIDDFSDDAEAFASAGWGTDEDYGFFGYDD